MNAIKRNTGKHRGTLLNAYFLRDIRECLNDCPQNSAKDETSLPEGKIEQKYSVKGKDCSLIDSRLCLSSFQIFRVKA